MAIEPGLSATIDHRVTEQHLALRFGSGDVPVLATPQVLAWCEQATCVALEGHLDADKTTVGMRVNLDHVKPTAAGGRVQAIARLEQVDGRRLNFVVTLLDEAGDEVALGRVVRVLVDRARFVEMATESAT